MVHCTRWASGLVWGLLRGLVGCNRCGPLSMLI
nr:MAG TPA: protein of unknown function (DUF4809) [Caudoviricetes sp.]